MSAVAAERPSNWLQVGLAASQNSSDLVSGSFQPRGRAAAVWLSGSKTMVGVGACCVGVPVTRFGDILMVSVSATPRFSVKFE
jgi:hypothetical protein